MPIYGYRCEQCGHELEAFQNMSDAPLRKMLYPVGVVFKGSGFYSTDYNKGGAKASANGGSESGSESKSESRSESKSESKPDSGSGSKSDSGSGSKADPGPKKPTAKTD